MGGDHHHHHKPKIVIPDYRTYKIEGVPRVEALQKFLASKGLKDPWLRNEVWRFDPKIWGEASAPTRWIRMMFRGFSYGLAAFIVTTSCEIAWAKYKGTDDSHGHGHGHGHGH